MQEIQVTATLTIDTSDTRPPSKPEELPPQVGLLPIPHEHRVHPTEPGGENATLIFIGTATTLLEWRGLRLMTDPNFLHLADHFPSTNYHPSTSFFSLTTTKTISTTWQAADISTGEAKLRVTAMPGKHVTGGLTEVVNKALGAISPTNGWIVELFGDSGKPYTIYISGDTLMVDELKAIQTKFPLVDLMLIHLGATTVPHPGMPLLTVTMGAEEGIQLVHLINPDVTIPIHYDDYDVFKSPLKDFQNLVAKSGLNNKVVYLGRGDRYLFRV